MHRQLHETEGVEGHPAQEEGQDDHGHGLGETIYMKMGGLPDFDSEQDASDTDGAEREKEA